MFRFNNTLFDNLLYIDVVDAFDIRRPLVLHLPEALAGEEVKVFHFGVDFVLKY